MARIVQITDCHLGPTPEYRLAGIRTLNSFFAVIDALTQAATPPELVLVSGDIAAHGSPEAYRHFIEKMDESGLPYRWLPGNHDDFKLMNRLNKAAFQPVVSVGNWQLLLLNTAVPNQVAGALAVDQLQLVEQKVTHNTHQKNASVASHSAIFMHHPPMDIDCQWLDRQQVANGQQLAAMINNSRSLKAIFTGHVHQQVDQQFVGIPLYSTPSTCFQFAPNSQDFGLDSLPPGYRCINLADDGSIDTKVVYLQNYDEKVDVGVQGY